MNGITQFIDVLSGAVVGEGAVAGSTIVIGDNGGWMIPPLPGFTFAAGYFQLALLVVEGLDSCDPGSFRLTNVSISGPQVW